MNRRESLKRIGLAAAGGMIPASVLATFRESSASIASGEREWRPRAATGPRAALLADLVDVVIPRTDTPGARDALVHVFVDLYVADCYPAVQREAFLRGIDEVDAAAARERSRPFRDLAADEKLGLLAALEKESLSKEEPVERSFVRMLKNLTLLGYFTSEAGATKAAEYLPSPGPFEGCVPMKPGQKVDAFNF
jgi:hypothetical protein